jgi:hypothetical protein
MQPYPVKPDPEKTAVRQRLPANLHSPVAGTTGTTGEGHRTFRAQEAVAYPASLLRDARRQTCPLPAMAGQGPRRIVPGRRRVFSQQSAGMCDYPILAPQGRCGRCARRFVPGVADAGRPGILAGALASRFWRPGCSKICHKVAACLTGTRTSWNGAAAGQSRCPGNCR